MKPIIAAFIFAVMALWSMPTLAEQPFNLTEALEERYDGKSDAPVVFYDFSSLSCPHCATFHDEIYPRIKAEFLDTGKARMIFAPMPLNSAALDGEKIARCLPKDQYIDALKLLYGNQRAWAFSNHRPALLEQAKLLGLSSEKAQACLDNRDLENGILALVRKDASRFSVQSTPTFIFEDGKRDLKGVSSFRQFERLLTYLYEEATGKTSKTDISAEDKLTHQHIKDADDAAIEAKATRVKEKAATE